MNVIATNTMNNRIHRLTPIAYALSFLILLSANRVPAQDKLTLPTCDQLSQQVKAKDPVKPDDWLKDLKKSNDGKWDVTENLSPQMAQILANARDAVKRESGKKKWSCEKAALDVGYGVLDNHASTPGLNALLGATLGNIKNIIDAAKDPAGFVAGKAKEAAEEALKKAIKTFFPKPEVFISEDNTPNGCKVKLVAIWDQVAGTYDVLIYGDCDCLPQKTSTQQGPFKVRTFAIRVTNKARVALDLKKFPFGINIADAAEAELCVKANCDCDKKKTTGTDTQPPPSTPPPPPPPSTQPPLKENPCDLEEPCKACMDIYDKIRKACDHIKEIGTELAKKQNEFNDNKKKIATGEVTQADQDYIETQIRQLDKERKELKLELVDLKQELEKCVKDKCGTEKLGGPPPPTPPPTPTPTPTSNPPENKKVALLPGYHVDTNAANGLYVTTFTTPQGKIKVNLTDDLAAGDTISGTVETEPAGKNDTERAQNQGELNGYVIELEGQKTRVGDKKFTCNIPVTLTPEARTIVLQLNGQTVAMTEIPILVTPPPTPTQFTLPTGGQQGRPIQLKGPCDGVFSPQDHVKVGPTILPPVAKSPRSLVVLNTSDVVGPTNIDCNENGVAMQCPFRNIGIKLSADKLNLQRGETTTLHVVVMGLAGITQDEPLDLVDTTPSVIKMSGGDVQHRLINPVAVQPDGTYSMELTLTGIMAGGFGVTGTIRWSDVCTHPAVSAAIPFLIRE